jgi:hypothetical protein
MIRRTLALAAVALAVTASPALASLQWYSQMKYGSDTASRSAGGCTISSGWIARSLRVQCPARHHATLTYSFPCHSKVSGTPRVGVSGDGSATIRSQVSVGKTAIKVTVTVSGQGSAQVNSVSVGYYAK